MKDSFAQHLARAKADHAMVAIYDEPRRPRSFVAGWVEAVSSEHVLLRQVSSNGFYDGFALRFLEDVFRVEHDDAYLGELALLYQAREQRHPSFLPEQLNADLLQETLHAAQRLALPVTISVEGADVSGWVQSVGTETLTLERAQTNGQPDGEAFLAFDSIEAVSVDELDLQDMAILSKRNGQPQPDWLDI